MFSWRKKRKIFGTGTRKNNCVYHKHSRKTSGEIFGAQIKARHLRQNQNNYPAMYMYTKFKFNFYVFSRRMQDRIFFSRKTKMLDACIRIHLGMRFARAFCCFGGPRGKPEEHLLNGNLQPNNTANKKNNTSPWKFFALRIKLLAG